MTTPITIERNGVTCELKDLLGRIICGDNIEVMSTWPAEIIDLVVTSPPYGDLRDYGKTSPWNFERLSYQLMRVLKPGGGGR